MTYRDAHKAPSTILAAKRPRVPLRSSVRCYPEGYRPAERRDRKPIRAHEYARSYDNISYTSEIGFHFDGDRRITIKCHNREYKGIVSRTFTFRQLQELIYAVPFAESPAEQILFLSSWLNRANGEIDYLKRKISGMARFEDV